MTKPRHNKDGTPVWFSNYNNMSASAINIIGLVMIFMVGMATGAILIQRYYGNRGRVVGLGIDLYWDEALTDRIDSTEEYQWGNVEAGSSYDATIYAKNNGTLPLFLTMYAQDYQPLEASEYLGMSWDYNGIAIPINGSRRLIFTLSVAIDSPMFNLFRYNTYIVADEAPTP